MSLLQQKLAAGKQTATSTAPQGRQSMNMVGLSLQVKDVFILPPKAGEQDEQLEVVGVVTNNTKLTHDGDEIRVAFRSKPGVALSNLIKGTGQGNGMIAVLKGNPQALAGTLLALEGCHPQMDDDKKPTFDPNGMPVFSSRWVTTVASNLKMTHSNRQMLDGIFAAPPVISFQNPFAGKPDEPKSIQLPVNTPADGSVWVKIPSGDGLLPTRKPLTWAQERLAAAKSPQVTVETYSSSPDEIVQVKSLAELRAVLEKQLAAGTTATAMIRMTDAPQHRSDASEIHHRRVFVSFKKEGDNYVPDVDATLDRLFANALFKDKEKKDIPAELFEDELKSGDFLMEVIPGYRFAFSGNAAKDDNISHTIVNDVLAGKTSGYRAVWGDQADSFAKVLLPGIARNDSLEGFSPTNFLAEEVGTWTVKTLPTPLTGHHQPVSTLQPVEEDDAPLPPPQQIEPESLEREQEPESPRP